MATATAGTKLADTDLPKRILDPLKQAGITTLAHLAAKTRQQVAEVPGINGHDMGFIDQVMRVRFVSYKAALGVYSVCKSCPACSDCGMPRATSARNVVVDLRGRAKHATVAGDPCDDCDQHHRQLVTAAAAA